MAVLEIPELQMQLDEDEAEIKISGQVGRSQEDLNRLQAQQNVTHLEYTRLDQAAKTRPGLIAQQEIDDWQGKNLGAELKLAGGRADLASAQSQLALGAGEAPARPGNFRLFQNHGAVQRCCDQAIRKSGHADAVGDEFEHTGAAAGTALGGR